MFFPSNLQLFYLPLVVTIFSFELQDYTHLKYCSSHPSLSNSGGVASENPEDHAYIHLKDCPPSSYTGKRHINLIFQVIFSFFIIIL